MTTVRVLRHNRGAPILKPTENRWESGVTFNAAVESLPANEQNRPIIRKLLKAAGRDGSEPQDLVAVLYRARPRSDPGYLMTRSSIGLALFDAELKLLHRFPEPLLGPDVSNSAPDYLGVEDPRVTRIGDRFVMVYCGCGEHRGTWLATLCTAESADLLHWQKGGPLDLSYSERTL